MDQMSTAKHTRLKGGKGEKQKQEQSPASTFYACEKGEGDEN